MKKIILIIIAVIIVLLIIQYVRFMNAMSKAKKEVKDGQCLGVNIFPFGRKKICKEVNQNVIVSNI